MRTDTLTKYRMALVKAQSFEGLQCHVLHIQDMIQRLETGTKITGLDEAWVVYFLNEKERH